MSDKPILSATEEARLNELELRHGRDDQPILSERELRELKSLRARRPSSVREGDDGRGALDRAIEMTYILEDLMRALEPLEGGDLHVVDDALADARRRLRAMSAARRKEPIDAA